MESTTALCEIPAGRGLLQQNTEIAQITSTQVSKY